MVYLPAWLAAFLSIYASSQPPILYPYFDILPHTDPTCSLFIRFYVAEERGWYKDASNKYSSASGSQRIVDDNFITREMRNQGPIFKSSDVKRNMRYAQLQAR